MVKTTEELLKEFQHFDDTRDLIQSAYTTLLDENVKNALTPAEHEMLYRVAEQLDLLYGAAKDLRFRLAQKSLDSA